MSFDGLSDLAALVDEVATLPAVAAEVVRRASDPNVELAELSTILEKDAPLTLRFLALANSAAIGGGRPVHDLRGALARLGLRRVRTAALCVTIHDLFPATAPAEGEAFDRIAFWKFNLGVAASAQALAERTKLASPQEAFLCGILHGLGKAILDQKQHDRFAIALRRSRDERIPLVSAEQLVFGFDHAELGARLLEEWNLAPTLVQVLRHQARHDQDPPPPPAARPLVALLDDAVRLCRTMQIGHDGELHEVPTIHDLLSGLRLTGDSLEATARRVRAEVELTAEMLGLRTPEPGQFLRAVEIANRELARLSLLGLRDELADAGSGGGRLR